MSNHSEVSVGGISTYEIHKCVDGKSEEMMSERGSRGRLMVIECHVLQSDRATLARQEPDEVTSQSNSCPSRAPQRRSLLPGPNVPRLKQFHQGVVSNESLETGSRPCGRRDFLLHLERLNFNFQAPGGGRRWREIKEARMDNERTRGWPFPGQVMTRPRPPGFLLGSSN